MDHAELDTRIAAIRRFDRFYTRQIGVLAEGYLESDFSLTEARVLYELAHRDRPTATEIARDLGLDAGYLSRILRSFKGRGLIHKELSGVDARQRFLSPSGGGGSSRRSTHAPGSGSGRCCVASRPRSRTAWSTR